MDRTYFLIGTDSSVMHVVQKHMKRHKEFQSAIEAFKVKHGADSLYTYGNTSIAGLRFDRELPKGWKRRQDGMCVPDARCKLGKEIKLEMKELPHGFDHWTFSSDLGESYLHFGGGQVHFSTLGQFGDKYVLGVPAACRVNPEGCTELKMSEYWQIREAAGQPKDEAAA